jgi:hypothetical protein
MIDWSERQRALLSDKLADLANLAAAGLLFGQALTSVVSVRVAVAGTASWVLLTAASMWLARK